MAALIHVFWLVGFALGACAAAEVHRSGAEIVSLYKATAGSRSRCQQ